MSVGSCKFHTELQQDFSTRGENEVGKVTRACLQQKVPAFSSPSGNGWWEWTVGMPVVFGFLPETFLGHQYHLMNHLGWLQKRADGSLMAPHWTGSPPLIIHHTAFMNPKWEAVHDSLFLSHRFKHPVFVPLSPQSSLCKHSCSSHSHWFTHLLLWTRKQKDYSSYVTINLESFQEEQTCKMWICVELHYTVRIIYKSPRRGRSTKTIFWGDN